MKYKIIYHVGDSVDIKTKVRSGKAYLTDSALIVEGEQPLNVAFASVQSVEMFRMHNLGGMIKIAGTQTVFLSVVRFNLLGYFAVINFFKTGALFEMLKDKTAPNQAL